MLEIRRMLSASGTPDGTGGQNDGGQGDVDTLVDDARQAAEDAAADLQAAEDAARQALEGPGGIREHLENALSNAAATYQATETAVRATLDTNLERISDDLQNDL
ncbi:MAG: hypothetical protein D6725_06355, partial [Planctomycetota bacterium]